MHEYEPVSNQCPEADLDSSSPRQTQTAGRPVHVGQATECGGFVRYDYLEILYNYTCSTSAKVSIGVVASYNNRRRYVS